MSISSSDPVSKLGQGDWQMGANRKASQLDAENSEHLDQMQRAREAESAVKADQERQQQALLAEQQNKLMQIQSQQAAG